MPLSITAHNAFTSLRQAIFIACRISRDLAGAHAAVTECFVHIFQNVSTLEMSTVTAASNFVSFRRTNCC